MWRGKVHGFADSNNTMTMMPGEPCITLPVPQRLVLDTPVDCMQMLRAAMPNACVRCGLNNHRDDTCRRRAPRCLVCGDHAHHTLQCDEIACGRCGDMGHPEECCRTRICTACHYRGHDVESCKTRCTRCNAVGEHVTFDCVGAAAKTLYVPAATKPAAVYNNSAPAEPAVFSFNNNAEFPPIGA